MIYDVLEVYVYLINALALILCGADKNAAKKHKWRIPEKTLFLFSVLGGATGFWIGMYAFKHKTKRRRFKIWIPVLSILQLSLLAYLFLKRVGADMIA